MPTLSVCMIVKDEEPTLERAILGIASVADEIIIVDTGSTDNSVEIAKKYTDKVFYFDWCDDFSAARNYSFERASGDYVMWLDADDVVTKDNVQIIRKLKTDGGFDVAFLKYASAFDGDGEPTFIYYRERIFLRSLNLRWEGVVHEAIAPTGKIIYSDACIFHKKVKSNSPMRNLRIYQNKIAGGGKLSPREQFYYGRELFYNNFTEECIAVLQSFLRSDGWVENKVEACRMLYRALSGLGRGEEALATLTGGFLFSFPHAEDCCILASHFEETGDITSAIFWYECALSNPEKLENGGFCNVDYSGFIPAIQLCVLYDRLGNLSKAEEYNELAGSFKPNNESYLYNKQYFSTKKSKG
ncbi:MAG: glycosyltransferase [Candidatus Coproplasma sp.]